MNLKKIRKEIDQIDDNIIRLLDKRFGLAVLAGKAKFAKGKPLLDKRREAAVIKRMLTKGQKINLDPLFIRDLFALIIDESKKLQYEK